MLGSMPETLSRNPVLTDLFAASVAPALIAALLEDLATEWPNYEIHPRAEIIRLEGQIKFWELQQSGEDISNPWNHCPYERPDSRKHNAWVGGFRDAELSYKQAISKGLTDPEILNLAVSSTQRDRDNITEYQDRMKNPHIPEEHISY